MVDTGLGFLNPTALPALDDEPVDSGEHRLLRRPESGDHMEDGEAAVLQLGRVADGAPGRRGDEVDALGDDELDDRGRIGHEGLGDVDAEGLVGEVLHAGDLVTDHVELPR
jgi:hypothetical protein